VGCFKNVFRRKKDFLSESIENTSLLSPISGIITARNYDNGDMYNGNTPVLVVEQIVPVKLLINISENYFSKIKKGSPVKVKFDVFEGEVFNGKISLIYPTINAATRTFPVELVLDIKI
jgi:multidrug resistance efflux pump